MVDTITDLLCPSCGKLMKKVYIENSNLNIDICL